MRRIHQTRNGASVALALLLGVSALPAVAQVNPFGKAGGDLSAEDWVAINEARDGTLADPAAVGASRAWTNPKSGNSGTIAITGVPRISRDVFLGDTSSRYSS